jgi:NADPH:quinone reductase-like Zn-dependent oxidoreductase
VLPAWLDGPLSASSFTSPKGVFASTIDRHEDALVAVPGYLSDAEAATLPVAALTAWHAVAELGAVRAGQTVVVQSTGGVSVFAIQFATSLGARVIVISRSDEKLAKARELGAWGTINSVQVPEWDKEVIKLTGGGAELLLDMGLDDSLRMSVRAASFEGTVAIIGVVQQQSNVLDIYPVMNKNLRIRGVETGSRAMVERMHKFMKAYTIRPVIATAFAANEAEDALDFLARSPFGKVVVKMGS